MYRNKNIYFLNISVSLCEVELSPINLRKRTSQQLSRKHFRLKGRTAGIITHYREDVHQLSTDAVGWGRVSHAGGYCAWFWLLSSRLERRHSEATTSEKTPPRRGAVYVSPGQRHAYYNQCNHTSLRYFSKDGPKEQVGISQVGDELVKKKLFW
jgi:hypothetical protein